MPSRTGRRSALAICLFAPWALACDQGPVAPEVTASMAVVAAEAVEVSITLSPHALVLGVEGTWVTVHTDVPFGSAVVSSLFLEGVPAAAAFADDRGFLVVKVHQADIEALVSPPEASLTLVGTFKDGTPFFGVDTIVVRERKAAPGRR